MRRFILILLLFLFSHPFAFADECERIFEEGTDPIEGIFDSLKIDFSTGQLTPLNRIAPEKAGNQIVAARAVLIAHESGYRARWIEPSSTFIPNRSFSLRASPVTFEAELTQDLKILKLKVIDSVFLGYEQVSPAEFAQGMIGTGASKKREKFPLEVKLPDSIGELSAYGELTFQYNGEGHLGHIDHHAASSAPIITMEGESNPKTFREIGAVNISRTPQRLIIEGRSPFKDEAFVALTNLLSTAKEAHRQYIEQIEEADPQSVADDQDTRELQTFTHHTITTAFFLADLDRIGQMAQLKQSMGEWGLGAQWQMDVALGKNYGPHPDIPFMRLKRRISLSSNKKEIQKEGWGLSHYDFYYDGIEANSDYFLIRVVQRDFVKPNIQAADIEISSPQTTLLRFYHDPKWGHQRYLRLMSVMSEGGETWIENEEGVRKILNNTGLGYFLAAFFGSRRPSVCWMNLGAQNTLLGLEFQNIYIGAILESLFTNDGKLDETIDLEALRHLYRFPKERN